METLPGRPGGTRRPSRPPAGDRGEQSLSYVGVVALVAGVVVALIAYGLPEIPARTSAAVCSVTGDQDCSSTDATDRAAAPGNAIASASGVSASGSPAPVDAGPEGETPAMEPVVAVAGSGTREREKPDDGNCTDFTDEVCEAIDGMRLGAGDVLDGAWNTVTSGVCLIGLCGPTKFVQKQDEIGDALADPVGTGKAAWEAETKPLREDRANGKDIRAANRGSVKMFGIVFGGGILGKLGKLTKTAKAARHEEGEVGDPVTNPGEEGSGTGRGAPPPRFVNLTTAAMTERFLAAPLFRKKAVVTVREAEEGEVVITRRPDGSVETRNVAKRGDKIIINPPRDGRPGEEYLPPPGTLETKYDHLGGNRYRAKGVIRAFRNPYGEHVELDAPWGEPMAGEPDAMFAMQVDPKHPKIPTRDRYVIFDRAFGDDFEPWDGSTP